MFNISGFLQKFLKFEKDNETKLSVILDVIKKETGLELSKAMLQIRGDSVRLNCSPIFRSEIFMHQTQIEEALKSEKVFLKII